MTFLLQQTVIYTVPLILVALAGVFAERSGIINLALEGIMIIGAFVGAWFVRIMQEGGWNEDAAQGLLLLALVVTAAGHLWYYAYMVRNRILEEVRADYVLLAKAKGLSRRKVLFRHCLRNILPPYFSMMAVAVPHILGGTYVVETVFSYPGLGALSYESARNQDTHLLMALCLLSGGAVMLCSMLAQAVNERVDPRTRSGGGTEDQIVQDGLQDHGEKDKGPGSRQKGGPAPAPAAEGEHHSQRHQQGHEDDGDKDDDGRY